LFGGAKVSGRSIRISARTLLELLAGKLDQETFLKAHGLVPSELTNTPYNFFLEKLERGQLLIDAEVEHIPDEDDDWIVFHFGELDTAISPFRANKL
jgi:hypothetical protein